MNTCKVFKTHQTVQSFVYIGNSLGFTELALRLTHDGPKLWASAAPTPTAHGNNTFLKICNKNWANKETVIETSMHRDRKPHFKFFNCQSTY